jgi:hypothetical protein
MGQPGQRLLSDCWENMEIRVWTNNVVFCSSCNAPTLVRIYIIAVIFIGGGNRNTRRKPINRFDLVSRKI